MSTIAAAIDALVAGLTAALAPVQVMDGPFVGETPDLDFVAVGGLLDDDSVTGEQVPAALGAQRREETYGITVQAAAYEGGGTQKAVRDRAFAHLAAVETWLRANYALGGVVRYAQVGGPISLDQRPPIDDDDVVLGRKAVVTFTVACSARI